jgi:hypothetical protein
MCVKMEFAFKPVLLLYVVSSQVRCWRQFSVLIQKMFCPAMYQFYLLRITYVTISDATSLFNEPIISRHEKSSSPTRTATFCLWRLSGGSSIVSLPHFIIITSSRSHCCCRPERITLREKHRIHLQSHRSRLQAT